MAASLAAVAGAAIAGESPRASKMPPSAAGAENPRTPMPKPPKAAKGTECVEPVADMRRNHMIYLEHERDETVHKGIRGRKHSLKGCVECHAVPDAAVAGESPRSSKTPPSAAGGVRTVAPFCAECHRYAAVAIDCFGCHALTPESQATLAPGKPP
jgi:hypothetical protein